LSAATAQATEDFVSFTKCNGMMHLSGSSDTVLYNRVEWKGVIMAVNNLRQDLKAVTGSPYAPVTVATVGKSSIAKKYAKYAKQLKGKWEQYMIITQPASHNGGRRLVNAVLSMAFMSSRGNWVYHHGIGWPTLQ
jgi:hypothetical protein